MNGPVAPFTSTVAVSAISTHSSCKYTRRGYFLETLPPSYRGRGREGGRKGTGVFFPGITAPSPETPTLPSDWWVAAGWMTSRRTVISEQNPAPIPQRIWQRILKKNRQQNPSRPWSTGADGRSPRLDFNRNQSGSNDPLTWENHHKFAIESIDRPVSGPTHCNSMETDSDWGFRHD